MKIKNHWCIVIPKNYGLLFWSEKKGNLGWRRKAMARSIMKLSYNEARRIIKHLKALHKPAGQDASTAFILKLIW